MSEESHLKEIATVAAPVIKSIVDTFIIPKIVKIRDKFQADYKQHYLPTESHFSEYYFRTYKKYSIVNTLVFHNSQRLLKDIYIPLSIVTTNHTKEKYKLHKFDSRLVQKHSKILITDTAGMGKSTVVKRIFLDIIDTTSGIPIIIELRRLNKEKKILNEIQEQLNSLTKDFNQELMLELINEGDFIFFLDGYDEIALSDRESVTFDIQNFISKAGLNKFFLTSRPETSLTSFGDFQQFQIEPLKKKEAFELIRKYDYSGSISKLLIKKLNERPFNDIEEFLTNPLLVSLLFAAFEYKQVIPIKKHIFYRQVFDANFESHDLTKGDSYIHEKHSRLSIDDFHRVLRHVGFSCLRLQKIEFTKDEILELIQNSKEFCVGLTFKSSDFLKDLLITVPLFAQDGIYYRWAHKSLQEYFAAQFIYLDSKDQQEKILMALYESTDIEKHHNILSLYYDIDYKQFRNVIIYNILKEYFEHYNQSYNNIQGVSAEDIHVRKNCSFWVVPVLYYEPTDLSYDELADDSKIPKEWASGMRFLEEKNALISTYFNPKTSLIAILASKKDKLFLNRDLNGKPNKYGITGETYIQSIKSLGELNVNSRIFFDEDNNNVSNAPELFAMSNEFLANYSIQYLLSHNIALTELENIEKTLNIESDAGFLLEGL